MITVLKATNHVSQTRVFWFCQVQLIQLYLETQFLLRDFYCPFFHKGEYRNVFRYVLSRLYRDCSPVSSLVVIILAVFSFFCNKEKNIYYGNTSNSDEHIKYIFMQRIFMPLCIESVAVFENCQWSHPFSKLDVDVFCIEETRALYCLRFENKVFPFMVVSS